MTFARLIAVFSVAACCHLALVETSEVSERETVCHPVGDHRFAKHWPIGNYRRTGTLARQNCDGQECPSYRADIHRVAVCFHMEAQSPLGTQRWAIVATAPALAGLADLLTAELSSKPGVSLVERERMDDVLNELKLNASGLVGSDHAVRFGEMAAADAMLFLEPLRDQEADSIRFRLVETRTALHLLDLTVPRKGIEEDIPLLAQELSRANVKVRIPAGERQYVGVMPIRSEESGSALKTQCRMLTTIVEGHLHRVPNVVVLQRDQLQRLTAEAGLTGLELKLRSAARLIEAGMRRNGRGMQIQFRVLSAGRESSPTIQVRTDTSDLREAGAELIAALTKQLELESRPAAADLVAEAEVFARRREFFARAYRDAEEAEMSEVAYALAPTPANLSAAIRAYYGWAHSADSRLKSDEALPAARRLNELRLEWYGKQPRNAELLRQWGHLLEPFKPHVRLPLEPETKEVQQIRRETDQLALQIYETALAWTADDLEARLRLQLHRLAFAAYLAPTGREFAASFPRLIDEIETRFEELDVSKTAGDPKYAKYARVLWPQVGQAIGNCDRSTVSMDERRWKREEVLPLWQKLVRNEDLLIRAAGYRGLIAMSEDDGTEAARDALELVARWPDQRQGMDEMRSSLLHAARRRLGGMNAGDAFFEGLLTDAERNNDTNSVVSLSNAIFFWIVDSPKEQKLARADRALSLLDKIDLESSSDPLLARKVSGARHNITKHLADAGLRRPPELSLADAPGAWQQYEVRRIAIDRGRENLGVSGVAVDHWPGAQERGGELVLLRHVGYGKYVVERTGLDGGKTTRIGTPFPARAKSFHGWQIVPQGEMIFIAPESPGIVVVRPEGSEVFGTDQGAPGEGLFAAGWLDGWLYVSYRDAFARFDPEAGTFELLASATALEKRSPLDRGGSYFIYKVLADTENRCLWLEVQDNAPPNARYGIWRYEPGTGEFSHMHFKKFHRTPTVSRDDGGLLFFVGGRFLWAQFDASTRQLLPIPGYTATKAPAGRPFSISRHIRVGDHIITGYGQLVTRAGEVFQAPTDKNWDLLQRVGPGFITHLAHQSCDIWYVAPKQAISDAGS